MRCNMCDRALSEKEVSWNDELPGWEPCTVCLDIALDAAYGQHRPDDDDVPLLDESFDDLESFTFSSMFPVDMQDEW